jgi:hypothetical protein
VAGGQSVTTVSHLTDGLTGELCSDDSLSDLHATSNLCGLKQCNPMQKVKESYSNCGQAEENTPEPGVRYIFRLRERKNILVYFRLYDI